MPIDPNNPILPDQASMQSQFDSIFGIAVFLVIVFAIGGIAVAMRNAGKAIDKGQNPLTVDFDLKLKALDSEVLTQERSTEDKLAEVERLYSTGSITADERTVAREGILRSL